MPGEGRRDEAGGEAERLKAEGQERSWEKEDRRWGESRNSEIRNQEIGGGRREAEGAGAGRGRKSRNLEIGNWEIREHRPRDYGTRTIWGKAETLTR
jgi:hypothetical protein